MVDNELDSRLRGNDKVSLNAKELDTIYPWQGSDYKHLISLGINLPHALILHSAKNLGVETLANIWIRYLLCSNQDNGYACGHCNSCVLLLDQNHPDLYLLKNNDEEEQKQITVAAIRNVVEFLAVGPHLGRKKIILIEDSSRLNLNSSNALLKILEEPPQYALFIILSNNLGGVLPTIKSRCMKYHITKPDFVTARDYHAKSDIPDLLFWLKFYDNCPLFDLVIDEHQLKQIIATLANPSIDNIYTATMDFDGKKVDFGVTLNFLNKWICDLIRFKLSNKLDYFENYHNNIIKLMDKIVIEKAFYLLDQINFFMRWENHPLNYKLQIENLFFKYQQVFVK